MPPQNDEWSQYEVKPTAKTAKTPAPKKDEWDQYEVSAPSTTASPDTSVPAPQQDWRDPLTKIHLHHLPTAEDNATFGSRSRYVGREAAKGVANIGAGGLGVILHPVDTAAGMGNLAYHAAEAATGNTQDLGQDAYQMGRQFYDQPLETAETMVGQTAVLDAAGRVIPRKSLAPRAGEPITTSRTTRAAKILTGTGPRGVGSLVDEVKAENVTRAENAHETQGRELKYERDLEAARGENDRVAREHQQAVELTDASNEAKMDEHAEKTRSVEEENASKIAEYEAGKTKAEELKKAAEEKETTRGKLARQVREQSARLINRVKSVQEKWKDSTAFQKTKGYKPTGILDVAFDQIRKATEGAVGSNDELAGSVRKALTKISGSTESIKIFKDILSKNPEDDPEFVNYNEGDGSVKIPKGNPLYDILREGQSEGAKPPTWKDLQGYYTELGRSLSTGNLPSDVYQALRSLQEDVGSQMQKMADSRGVGAKWKMARSQYRDYMQTFVEDTGPNHSGSPIAQSLNAADPDYAIKPLTAEETAQRVRNMLTRFDPPKDGVGGAAKLYDNFRKANRDFDTIGNPIKVPESPLAPKLSTPPIAPALQPRPVAPPPKFPEPPERVGPSEPRTISPEDIQSRHRADLKNSADRAGSIGQRALDWKTVAAGGGVVGLLAEYQGAGTALAAVGAALAAPFAMEGLARFLERPGVIAKLEKITPADIAKVPPELRSQALRDLSQMMREGAKKGARINPRVWALVVGSQTQLAPRKNATDEWAGTGVQ